MLWYYWYKRFDGHGSETSIGMIKEQVGMVNNNYEIQLFEQDKIIKLDIPFSEIYHQCTESEWNELLDHISKVLGHDVRKDKRMKPGVKFREAVRKFFGLA